MKIEEEIVVHLRSLVSATEAADAVGILAATKELDRLKIERSDEIKGHLAHYLQNRSYGKALAMLENKK